MLKNCELRLIYICMYDHITPSMWLASDWDDK
jgi:hypothetical protein